MNEHSCLVCGYDGDAEFYPHSYMICGCCGTEFGYDDRVLTHDQLRNIWIAAGFPWFDENEPRPDGWNPQVQLENAGLAEKAAPMAPRALTIAVPGRLLGRLNVYRSYAASQPADDETYTEHLRKPVIIGEWQTV
jgi:hypothetical protein